MPPKNEEGSKETLEDINENENYRLSTILASGNGGTRNSMIQLLSATFGNKKKEEDPYKQKSAASAEKMDEENTGPKFSIAGYHNITAANAKRLSVNVANQVLAGVRPGANAEEDHPFATEEDSDDEPLPQAGAPTDKDKERAGLGLEKDIYTEGFTFCLFSAIQSVANLLLLGMRADLRCHTNWCPGISSVWDNLQQVFVAWAFVEIVLRMLAAGPRRYFTGERTKEFYKLDVLNCIDITVVSLGCLDCWLLSPIGVESNLRLLLGFRIMHVFPLVKLVQLNRSFRELWLVVAAIAEVLGTLFWIGLMVLGTVWVASVVIRMALMDSGAEDFDMGRAPRGWDEYWGGVLQVSHSLLQVLTRDRWADTIVWPIVQTNGLLMILFLTFLSVANLSLMNVIIGVVVESTLSAATANHALDNKEKEKADGYVLDSLKAHFHKADRDRSGEIDTKELSYLLKSGDVKARLEYLQLEVKDLVLIFHLLDDFHTGAVNTDKFFRAVARLRGPAKAADLFQLSLDLQRDLSWANVYNARLALVNDLLAEVVDRADEVDVEIIHGDNDFRDPVLVARRTRTKFSISAMLRGKLTITGQDISKASKDPWEIIREANEADTEDGTSILEDPGLLKRGSGTKESLPSSMLTSEASSEMWDPSAEPKVKTKVKVKRKSNVEVNARTAAPKKNAPPPPALPRVVARVKVEEQLKEQKKAAKRKTVTTEKRKYEF
mmetsp:Transcript_80792/g.142489  ORF Transcript_80792/g.142489 Transcript_80792/m.142489 type:complete len:721 (-) Transcript_80792:116-2278(-)